MKSTSSDFSLTGMHSPYWFIPMLMGLVLLFPQFALGQPPAPRHQALLDYWYKGKAELTRYNLSQARYGELHKGYAALIFVTEDFLKEEQVKLDRGPSDDAVSVLKMNVTRSFFTGIYPYSLMTSVFTPADVRKYPHSLKATFTGQEWCGHVFMQLNRRGNSYRGILKSYFQSEGDRELEIKGDALLEDELWNRIRIAPHTLPTGDIELIPSLQFLRLRHLDMNAEKATAVLKETMNAPLSSNPLYEYTVTYRDLHRIVTIFFEKEFPHIIAGWQEEILSGFGPKARPLTTIAVRTNTLFTDYWTKNAVADYTFRKELGIEVIQ